MSHTTITFLVLAAAVVLFLWDRLPVAIVAMAVPLSLWATGVLNLQQSVAGFGEPTVLFIAALFVVSDALDSTGVTTWVGQRLIQLAGEGRSRVLIYTLGLVAVVTALINVNASVAALLPVVVIIAVRLGEPPSQLLMPLAFGAHAGSLLALTGTPVNVLVLEAAAEAGLRPFGYFEFALVGIPLVIGTIAIVVLFGERLLPRRSVRSIGRDLSGHGKTLIEHYELEQPPEQLLSPTSGLAEVMIPPRSDLVGDTFFPGMVTESGELVVLAILRNGRKLSGERELEVGDTLLLQGTWRALEYQIAQSSVLTVDRVELVRRHAVPLGTGALRGVGVLLGMVILLATGLIPAAVAGLVAACATVLLGVVTLQQAYRSIAWNTVILVAGMMALSTAMVESGAAAKLADMLVGVVGHAGPYALLLGLFLLTAALGQLISNMATALIVIPVALSAAAEMGISARPVLMSVAVSAAAAFLTPIATPANLMIMGPGAYRFGDYWKLGLPLLALYGLAAVLLVPLIWSF